MKRDELDMIKKDLKEIKKMKNLIKKGLKKGKISLFDDKFYEQLSHTYINGLPVSIHIKYLKPETSPGGCYERSLFMFLCFDNALLVRGDNRNLEILYGPDEAGHGWIEIDNYVYDPSLLMKFDKELYYKIFSPKNIIKCTKEEYCKNDINKCFYEYVKNTKIEDYQPGGNKRHSLNCIVPLVKYAAKNSNNDQFIIDLNNWLNIIQYDEYQVTNELNKKIYNKKI